MPNHRIVSLIPSGTEIVAALGFQEQLVGRSHECDYPASVAELPVCTASRVDAGGTSRQIEDEVRAKLVDAVALYDVHTDVLRQARPTLIVTQAQCEVCAVSLRDVEQAVCGLFESRPKIVSLEPMALADVWNDVRRVADALEAPDRGAALTERLLGRLAALRDRCAPLPKPRVACLEWLDPLMAAGNWVPELVEIAGGENVLGEAGQHSPWIDWDALAAADPDVIVAIPCGFDLERVRGEMTALAAHSEWSTLRAVRAGRVLIADGSQFFNRPGPRLVESAEILAEILHPGAIEFGHRGAAWQPFAAER